MFSKMFFGKSCKAFYITPRATERDIVMCLPNVFCWRVVQFEGEASEQRLNALIFHTCGARRSLEWSREMIVPQPESVHFELRSGLEVCQFCFWA